MIRAQRQPSKRLLAAEIVLGVLLLFECFALASAPTWTLWPAAVLAPLALLLATLGAREQGRAFAWPAFSWLLLLASAACAVQLLPLPPSQLATISPRAGELVDFILRPLGLSDVRPISVDPPATWRALSQGLSALAVFLTAAQLARLEAPRQRLAIGLALLAAVLVLIGAAHWLAGTELLFGLYRFQVVAPPVITPFANPNQLAGFLGLGAALAIGGARSTRVKGRLRQLLLAAWVLASVGVLAAHSAGGVVAWLVGQGFFVLLVWRERRNAEPANGAPARKRRTQRWEAPALAGGLLLFFGAGLWASRPLMRELEKITSLEGLADSKLELLPGFFNLARAFPWTGVGRGTFEAAWPRFAEAPRNETFTHPENALLQWATEFGLPLAAVLILGVLGCGVWLLSRSRMGALRLGALAGLAGLSLQNLVDFSLELPFVAHAALVALAVAWPVAEVASGSEVARTTGQALPRIRRRLTRLAPWGIGALGAVALIALIPGRSTLAASEEAVRESLRKGVPDAALRAQVLEAVDRHPAHWPLYALAAESAARPGGDPREALAFVNRALFLNPFHGESHRAAARALLRLGARGQAFGEYRLAALAHDPGALDEAMRRARITSERVALTPDPARALRVSHALATRGEAAAALDYLSAVQGRFLEAPGIEQSRLVLAEARLHLAARDHERAVEACERARILAPDALEPGLVRAELLRATGRPDEAIALLESLVGRHPGRVEVGLALAREHLLARNPKASRAALAQVGPFLSTFAQRARWLEADARIDELEGAFHRAAGTRRSACRLVPTYACWASLASSWEKLGSTTHAVEALREARAHVPAGRHEALDAWIARLEAQQKHPSGAPPKGARRRMGTQDTSEAGPLDAP